MATKTFGWTSRNKKYIYRRDEGYDSFLLEKVISLVIKYCNSKMTDTLYTWQGVNNALLRDRLQNSVKERLAAEEAKKKAEEETSQIRENMDEKERRFREQALEDAKAEADMLLESFDEDLTRLQRQVDELTRANEALQYENHGLRAKLGAVESVPVLRMGDEFEFYQGEIKDLLLSVLSDALSGIQPKSRRQDVVKDVIDNNDYRKQSEKRAEEVKVLLKNYTGLTPRLKQALEDLGFEIREDGKHCKLTYYGDGRYTTVLAKTPSDVRSGKNNAQQIIRDMF